MTTAVQHRRGTTAEHATFTGLEGEVTIDTTKDTAVIHDGILAGGVPLARENLANVSPSGLATITGASTASDDKFFVYDQSATTLKSITRAELNNAMEIDALASVTITGGTINGTTIGNTTAAAGSFTTLSASGTVTIPDNAISGDKVEGGTINAITINTLTSGNLAYTGTLTGGTGVVNLGSGQVYKDASGNVGIGTSSPLSKFHIQNTSANDGIRIISSTTGEGFIIFGDTADTNTGAIAYNHTSDAMTFDANNAERMRITSAGNVYIGNPTPSFTANFVIEETSTSGTNHFIQRWNTSSGGTMSVLVDDLSAPNPTWMLRTGTTETLAFEVGVSEKMRITSEAGYVRLASGTGGIQFNGDTAAANALDDYEEGTWTPQISDGGNIANFGGVTQGTYTKIGRVVTLTCRAININTTGLTPSNVAYLTNLPFSTGGSNYWFGSVNWRTPTDTTYTFSFLLGQGVSASFINSAGTSMIVSDLNSGGSDLFFSVTYEIV